jgi:Optic atrophy 3 protein (OPA3)
MIPFIKLAMIMAKMFTAPLIKFSKQHTKQRLVFLRKYLISIGNSIHRFEARVNKAYSNIQIKDTDKEKFIKNLSDDKAFDYGVTFLLEFVLLYSIILGIAISEVKKGNEDKKKEKAEIDSINDNFAFAKNEVAKEIEISKNLAKAVDEIKNEQSAIADKIKNLANEITENIKIAQENDSILSKIYDQEYKALVEARVAFHLKEL